MQRNIEFHDSEIVGMTQNGSTICLSVDAYIHQWEKIDDKWKGTGWVEPIKITMTGTSQTKTFPIPFRIDGGTLETNSEMYSNMVPLPFMSSKPTTLRLEMAEVIQIKGKTITIESAGSAQYVEDLPKEFKPKDAG